MAEERSQGNKSADPQRDKTDRPKPPIDPAEGDEETIDEDLRKKEQEKRR